jgi:chromate transporter
VAILALSMIYALYGGVGLVSGLLFGLQAAVVAVVVEAVIRIGRRALKTGAHLALAAAAFAAVFFAEVPFPIVVLVAGLLGFVGGRVRPDLFGGGVGHGSRAESARALIDDDGATVGAESGRAARKAAAVALGLWLLPVAVLVLVLGADHVFAREAVFFSQTAVVTFGGAYAVLSYIAQQAVDTYGWLQPGEMLTGLGMAETTPGPLIMVVQFVGFLAAYRSPGGLSPLAAGVLGSAVTTWVTFAPCFFFIFAGAPYVERLRGNRSLATALAAITAAVVGVVLNLAVWFAVHTAFDRVGEVRIGGLRLLVPELLSADVAAVAIMAIAAVAIFRLKLGVMKTLGLCAALGLVVALATGTAA